MSYTIIIKKKASKELSSLAPWDIKHITSVIDGLSENPRPAGTKKLTGQKFWWRIRAGDYRILYSIDDMDKIVTVFRIGHRKDVYRF